MKTVIQRSVIKHEKHLVK